jgi:hypothetical protein
MISSSCVRTCRAKLSSANAATHSSPRINPISPSSNAARQRNADLDRELLLLLLRGTTAARVRASADRLASVERMEVTLASEVLVLRRAAGD